MSGTAERSVLEELADFSHAAGANTIPADARHEAVLCILDTIGCIAAGAITQEAAQMRSAEAADGAGESIVVGTGLRLKPTAAARANGYAGDIFEVNDLIGGHASIGVVSAALALAGQQGTTGADLVEAVAAGVEVTARLYNTFYPNLKSYEVCGMVSVGLPSAAGSAAAAAKLLRLSGEETRQALLIAAALAGWCPAEVIFGDGGTVKPMLFGASPASTGLMAAGYARAGLTGPRAIMESRIGYFATMAQSYDRTAIAPAEWALERPRRKMHACCGYIHSALDAVVTLRHAQPGAMADAATITVELPPYILPAVVKSRPPVSPNDARFHAGYCIATALQGAEAIIPAHTEGFAVAMQDDRLRSVMDAVQVVPSTRFNHYHQSRVTVTDHQGRIYSQEISAPKGSSANPLSQAELITKFDGLAQATFEAELAGIRSELLALDGVGDLRGLLTRLGAAPLHDGQRQGRAA